MKKTIALCMIAAVLFACKKKEDPTPEPEPVVPPKVVSAKVNGSDKSCSNACYSSSNSAGLRGLYLYLAGYDESIYFSCDALPAKGPHNLVKFGEPFVMYIKNNVYYRAVNGSINISAIDTSANGVIKKMVASFSFQTDTNS